MTNSPNLCGQLLNWCLRLAVAGPFIYAGVLKISDPATFATSVSNFRVVPYEWTHLIAIIIPWIEVLAGVLVLAGFWLRAATLVIASLTFVFIVLISSALVRGLNIECGCFGTAAGSKIGLKNLAIDLALFVGAAWLMCRAKEKPATTP
jgi:uncharacterized membrane protein YphA (DoxX/SURF4 family)